MAHRTSDQFLVPWSALHESTVREITSGREHSSGVGWMCGCRPDPPVYDSSDSSDSEEVRLCGFHAGYDTGYELGEAVAEMHCRDRHGRFIDREGRGLSAPVEVDLWTVVMAIRYGLGRMTYANSDAATLARRFWDRLDLNIRQQVWDDAQRIEGFDRDAWAWLLDQQRPVF